MQINRKSFGTLKSDRYGPVTVMDEWPLRQVLLYLPVVLAHQVNIDLFMLDKEPINRLQKTHSDRSLTLTVRMESNGCQILI